MFTAGGEFDYAALGGSKSRKSNSNSKSKSKSRKSRRGGSDTDDDLEQLQWAVDSLSKTVGGSAPVDFAGVGPGIETIVPSGNVLFGPADHIQGGGSGSGLAVEMNGGAKKNAKAKTKSKTKKTRGGDAPIDYPTTFTNEMAHNHVGGGCGCETTTLGGETTTLGGKTLEQQGGFAGLSKFTEALMKMVAAKQKKPSTHKSTKPATTHKPKPKSKSSKSTKH